MVQQDSIPSVFEREIVRHDSWTGKDKVLHIVCSALATGAGSYLSEYRWHWDEETGNRFGVALALTLGLSKEINDKTVGYGYFSWKDLAADIAGVFIGLLITGLW